MFPNWIDSDLFSLKVKTSTRIGYCLLVGFLDEKNLDLLINALSGIDVSLDLVGHGKLIESYKNTASKCKVRLTFWLFT